METLAWITDDEAEFWACKSPVGKTAVSDLSSKSKGLPSTILLKDGLYFKFDNKINPEIEDHLSLLYKQGIEQQAKEVGEEAEKKPTSEIFEFNDNLQPIENMPGISMTFLDRLFHQLTRPPSSDFDDYSDEEFTEIDESEITTVVNNNTDLINSLDEKNNSTSEISLIKKIRLFIDDVNEETDVIRGTLDEDTFLNRRSRRAKSLYAPTNNHTMLSHSTSL